MDSTAVNDSEMIHSLQHTMLWNEEHCLDIAPGQNRKPESLLFDQFAEELSLGLDFFAAFRNPSDLARIISNWNQRNAHNFEIILVEWEIFLNAAKQPGPSHSEARRTEESGTGCEGSWSNDFARSELRSERAVVTARDEDFDVGESEEDEKKSEAERVKP